DFDLYPMCWRLPSTEAGLINSVHSLRAAVLAAYSAKRNQTNAIWSITERLREDSILRASSTHFAAKCPYASNLSTGYVPKSGNVSQFPRIVRSVSERHPVTN